AAGILRRSPPLHASLPSVGPGLRAASGSGPLHPPSGFRQDAVPLPSEPPHLPTRTVSPRAASAPDPIHAPPAATPSVARPASPHRTPAFHPPSSPASPASACPPRALHQAFLRANSHPSAMPFGALPPAPSP